MAKKTRRRATTTRSGSGSGRQRTQPARPSPAAPMRSRRVSAPPDVRWVTIGPVAVVGLVFLVGAGIGAGVLLAGVAAALLYVGRTIADVSRGERVVVAAQKAVVLALLFLLPVTIDPRTADVFATVKFSILATGGVLLLGLLVADLVVRRDRPRPTVVHGLVALLVVWGVVATVASGHAKLSTLGYYSSNNGLVTLVCLALIFAVTASSFRARDVRPAVSALWFATTGVVVLYGVLQLLDQAWSGHGLEPVDWPSGVGVKVFGSTGVWATFGNPNHLGGFCAIALPLGIAMLFSARARWERYLSVAILAGSALIIGQTSSRGAWVAAAVSVLAMAVLNRSVIFGMLRRRPLITAGGAVVVAASAAFSLNSGLLSKGAATLFDTGGSTTIAQRLHFWRTTVRMAGDHPLTGFGMDGYRLTFPHFASMRYIRLWGYDLQVTGPHNTFMAHLYWGGWPALALFVAVIVLVGVMFARALRRLRGDDPVEIALPLTAIAVASVAYLLVESFNVERLELAAIFWFAVGLLVAVARPGEAAAATAAPARGRTRPRAGDAWAVAAATTVALVLMVWTTAPWRADNSLRSAGVASNRSRALTSANPQLAAERSQASRDDIDAAVSTNPWEARYVRTRAEAAKGGANGLLQQQRVDDAAQLLRRSSDDYGRALALTPHDATLAGSRAEVLYRLADVTRDPAPARQATALLERELRWAPRNGRLRSFLGLQRIAHDEKDAGLRDLDAAVAMFPRDAAVLRYAENGYRAAGLTDKADGIAARLKRLE